MRITNHDDAERSCFTCSNAFVDDEGNLVCVEHDAKIVEVNETCDDWN